MWKTFGGFDAKGLQGLIMGSRASGDLAGKEGVVLKAELLAMLIQLAFMGRRDELALPKCDMPQVYSYYTIPLRYILADRYLFPRL